MEIRAVLFDVNGTLIDIETDECMEEAYRANAHYLTYQGIPLRRGEVRDLYFQIVKEQFAASKEIYPEFDVVAVWREVLRQSATGYTRSLASVYELQPRTCVEAAADRRPAGQRLYSLNPGFAVAIQIKEAVERLLGGVHFRESRLEAGPSW